ncbi:unnamed protein product [Laminaria digitata]
MANDYSDHSRGNLKRQSSELDEEVTLYSDAWERRKWDKLSEFFAIIKTTEHLENARIKSSIGRDEYTRECSALISQYKDAESALLADGSITSTVKFIKEYQLDCPYAMDRLVKYGVPATVLHRQVDERDQIGRARQAAETTQCFITAMDALKLEQRAVDEVQPLIYDLSDRLNKVDGLPNDYEGTAKTREWIVTLNGMRAADELSEDQARQLLHDLDTSYSAFFRFLEMTQKP